MQNPYSNSAINGLDGEMKQILDNANLNDREKWAQYYQILQRYFQHNKIQRQPVELDITDFAQSNGSNLSNQDIISTFPISMQKQAERLLNWIKRSNVNICWDEKGEVAVKDHTIRGSNIIDLIGDLIRYRKTAIPPTGYNPFIRALKETNIPEELIGNRERLKQMSTLNAVYDENMYKSPGEMVLPTPPKIIKTPKNLLKSTEQTTPVLQRFSNPRRSILAQIEGEPTQTLSAEQKLVQILKNKSAMNLRPRTEPSKWHIWK